MARMYSRAKGKSASKKPLVRAPPTWMTYSNKEIELLVMKLAREGNSTSQIGLILRDRYGIPDVKSVTKKSISTILKEKKLLKEVPEDLASLAHRVIQLKKHLEENKQDKVALRGLTITESKIKRLVKYYKRVEKLPLDWKYDLESLRLTLE
jgi:small subunit ribosomal protein S15